MKRILAVALVVLLVAALFVGCSKGGIYGTYKLTKASFAGLEMDPSAIGMDMSITLKDGGTGSMTVSRDGETESADITWTQDGDKITVSFEGEDQVFTLKDGSLTIEESGATVILEKQ